MSLSVDQAIRRAESHARKGEADLAAQKYGSVLEKYPKNQQGKLQETLVQGEALAMQFLNEPITANLLGAVYVALGHLEQAVASYARALQIKPDFAVA